MLGDMRLLQYHAAFIPILLLMICSSFAGTPAHPRKQDPKFAYIAQLPGLRAAAYKKAKAGWDTGVTSKMIDASQQYESELLRMCEGLAARYYPKKHFGPAGIRPLLTGQMKSVEKMSLLIHDVDGDGGGTINPVMAEGDVMAFLESTVRNMVSQVTMSDDQFDFKRWEALWNKAAAGQ